MVSNLKQTPLNGLKDVPARLLTPIEVNKENIDATVIKDGFHKRVNCNPALPLPCGGASTCAVLPSGHVEQLCLIYLK
jgi:hypothetical protein